MVWCRFDGPALQDLTPLLAAGGLGLHWAMGLSCGLLLANGAEQGAAARPGADARGARARAQVWDRRALGRGAKPAGVLVGHTEGLTHLDSRGARPRCPRGAAPACAAQGTQTRALRHSASCCSVCVVVQDEAIGRCAACQGSDDGRT